MCELFGLTSRKKVSCNEMLKNFFSHGDKNPHGWGLALFFGNSVSVEKQPISAIHSRYLTDRLRSDIQAEHLLAHIRLATKGGIEYDNTHPFVMRDLTDRAWTLEHNGTVFESDILKKYIHVQEGQTDTERILCYLIDEVNLALEKKGADLTDSERCEIVDRVIREVSPENKMNLLISDEELLYVHTNYKNSLYYQKRAIETYISTSPLTLSGWEQFPLNTLIAYRSGEVVYRGEPHEFEFFDSEEKMKYIFLDYAQL
ncbi:MAG: class II glutamine amidotransferase [Eubacterium sp.]|nr:class II glutamine amidotransferase [Eubacterium sp.]